MFYIVRRVLQFAIFKKECVPNGESVYTKYIENKYLVFEGDLRKWKYSTNNNACKVCL